MNVTLGSFKLNKHFEHTVNDSWRGDNQWLWYKLYDIETFEIYKEETHLAQHFLCIN